MAENISETAKVYAGRYKHLYAKFKAEEFDECDRLASTLLTKAELPVIIRARCHMILATACAQDSRDEGKHTNFVGHADAAVHVLRKAKEQGPEVKDKSIQGAEKLQKWAKDSYQELVDSGAYATDEGEPEEDSDLEAGAIGEEREGDQGGRGGDKQSGEVEGRDSEGSEASDAGSQEGATGASDVV